MDARVRLALIFGLIVVKMDHLDLGRGLHRNCVKDGDIVTIDAEKGTIDVRLTPAELEDRKRQWKPRITAYGSGALQKFAALVGPAHKGATTHPGFAGERHVYADI